MVIEHYIKTTQTSFKLVMIIQGAKTASYKCNLPLLFFFTTDNWLVSSSTVFSNKHPHSSFVNMWQRQRAQNILNSYLKEGNKL